MNGVGGMGGADKISRTANHLSTLQPVTDEQICSREEAARAGGIDWRLEGAVGGQLSVIWPSEALGTPVHLCSGLDDPFNGRSVQDSVMSKAGRGCCYSAHKRAVDPQYRSPE